MNNNKKILPLTLAAIVSGCISVNALANQSWSYGYNAMGLIESVDGPRQDVTDITTYAYDNKGNRISITNALGHVVQLQDYNGRGQPQKMIDANGVVTGLTYHSRGWLLGSEIDTSAGVETTIYNYDAVGQLLKLTLPTGVYVEYEYDDARRLVGISNAAGERIAYTLDAAGNRTSETVFSANSEIKRTLSKVFDELSRVRDVVGANQQSTQYDYDVNNNPVETTDGRQNSTQQAYDALNRVTEVTDANNHPANYTYNSQDLITSVIDQRGLTTRYEYNGLGQLVSQQSPDSGVTEFSYDEAGNLTAKVDARGVVSQYRYDALNRLASVLYPAKPDLNIEYGYDDVENGNFGVGRLTSITDNRGVTAYHYDARGQLLQTAREIDGVISSLNYRYDLAGNLSAIGYPSGRWVQYQRDEAGRVTGVTTQDNIEQPAKVLAQDVSYLPFGPRTSIQYGNGLSAQRDYDQDYRLTSLQVEGSGGALKSLSYQHDGNNNITHIADSIDTDLTQSLTYDAVNRLEQVADSELQLDYAYDEVGNRIERNLTVDNQTSSEHYNYASSSNRLLTVEEGSGNRELTYDANGNLIKDKRADGSLWQFEYDDNNRLKTVTKGGAL